MAGTVEMVSIILSSSLIGGALTLGYNIYHDNKTNMIEKVTDERTKWRDKIREITINIKESEFQGTGEKNVTKYLTELEVNINAYGKFSYDFRQDSNIWENIKLILDAESKNEFENSKEMLIYHISMMLKEDWERSKLEIKGYKSLILQIVLAIITSTFFGICWFIEWELKSIIEFIMWDLLFCFISIGIPKYVKLNSIENFIVRRKLNYSYVARFSIFMILTVLGCTIFLVLGILGLVYRVDASMQEKVSCTRMKNTVYVYMGVKSADYSEKIYEKIQKVIYPTDKLVFVKSKRDLKGIQIDLGSKFKNSQKTKLIFTVCTLLIFWIFLLGLVCVEILDDKNKRFIMYIDIVKARYDYLGYNIVCIVEAVADIKHLISEGNADNDIAKMKRKKKYVLKEIKLLKYEFKGRKKRLKRLDLSLERYVKIEDINDAMKKLRNIEKKIKYIKDINRIEKNEKRNLIICLIQLG